MPETAKRKRVSGTTLHLVTPQEALTLAQKVTNPAAEEAVIGAVLRDPSVYASVSEILQPSDFHILSNGYIWHAFDLITGRSEAIDTVTVADQLDALNQLNGDDGIMHLAQLAANAPRAHNAETYARIVRDAATRLRLLAMTEAIKACIVDRDKYRDIDALVDECNRLLFEATDQQMVGSQSGMFEIVNAYFALVEDAMNHGVIRGIPTGYGNLDKLLRGAVAGELTIMAGGEGMGKTTFMLGIARNLALKGLHTAVFTLEMSQEEIIRILIGMETGIAKRALKAFDLTQAQWGQFVEITGKVAQWPIDIVDEFPSLSPIQLRRRLRTMIDAERKQINAVIIDGLWLMEDSEPAETRQIAVRNITRDLIQIARDFNVPIYITHQYNGEAWQRQDKRPRLHDLAESAGVRRNAQVILGLYRENYYQESGDSTTELHVLKDRNGSGAQGKHVDFLFDAAKNLFLPLAEDGYAD